MKISEMKFYGPHFVYIEPTWAKWGAVLMVLVFSGGYLIGFSKISEQAGWMVWLPSPLILICLWAIFRPSFWEPRISFAADGRGVYFVLHQSECFHVPWDRVGEITLHHSYGGSHGGSTDILVKVKLEAEERNQLVRDFFIDPSDTQNGYNGMRVGNVISPKKALKKITQLQMLYASSKGRHAS
jgi:hypothetical protein